MKICLAQTKSIKADIAKNIKLHAGWVKLAADNQADLICFPELSLTAYEPTLGKELATNQDDPRLDELQELCDRYEIVVAVGLPIKTGQNVGIGMVILLPSTNRLTCIKQILHDDELPYFQAGNEQIIFEVAGEKIAPAICYESMQKDHTAQAKSMGASIYLASVAKNKHGLQSARNHYPAMAKKYDIPILMSNCVGYCDNFLSDGQSGVWDMQGQLIAQLDSTSEGLLIFDTVSLEVQIVTANTAQ